MASLSRPDDNSSGAGGNSLLAFKHGRVLRAHRHHTARLLLALQDPACCLVLATHAPWQP